jgi:hypothetical protein
MSQYGKKRSFELRSIDFYEGVKNTRGEASPAQLQLSSAPAQFVSDRVSRVLLAEMAGQTPASEQCPPLAAACAS